ncbi:MAG: HAD-IA family hydrolase [Xanthomonadales bacterium]|nr:HAD-IA family hydrolase [Xanthomonadales bacterium]
MALPRQLNAALFGKPRNGWGSRELISLEAGTQIESGLHQQLAESHCWVPLIRNFREFSVDFAIDFSERVSRLTLRERIRTSGGFAVISDSVKDTALLNLAEAVADWLVSRGGRGLFNVQLLLPEAGTAFVSDVNPRHGTSSVHTLGERNHLIAFLAGIPLAAPRPDGWRSIRLLQQHFMPLRHRHAIRALVFDLDDTLIDQRRWMLAKLEFIGSALDGKIEADRFRELAWQVVDEGPHDRMLDLLIERMAIDVDREWMIEAYRRALPVTTPLHDDVTDVLGCLRGRNLRLGLLSDNPPASQRSKLAQAPVLEPLLDAVVFTREFGAEKPDPAGFQAVAAQLGVPPQSILMVGDNPIRDALGAYRAGFAGCLLVQRTGRSDGARSRRFFEAFPELDGFSWFAEDLRDLPFIVGQPSDCRAKDH